MRRLRANSFLNAPEEFEKQFHQRRGKTDWFDSIRFEKLINHFKGGRLIDLGCLDSLVPILALKRFPEAEVWGLDQAKGAIDILSKEHPEVNYVHGDVYDTKLPDNHFNYAVAGELIEHLDRPQDFFKETFRILKRGGILALTTPREETDAGEVDGGAHLWSITRRDLKDIVAPYTSRVKIGTLKSKYFPKYKYHFPYHIMWAYKK